MADEAFALSPISARAAQPSAEDYDAIREAFMETSRGRWFLGEYSKRNRNADTRMVLDAVARIEETLAAQKQPASDNGLAETMAAIRGAVEEARAAASAALGGMALEENLAPARKGARVIREIAWRLREIGADGRICDLIDSQVSAIEAACETVAETDPGSSVSAAFDLIDAGIATFDDGDAAAPPPAEQAMASSPPAADEEVPASAPASEEAVASPTSAAHDAAPDAAVETVQTVTIVYEAEDAISSAAIPAEPTAATAEAADMSSESDDVSAEAAEAHDDAVLELIAHEMAALDPADADDPPDDETYQIEAAELPPAASVIAAEPEPQIAAPEIQPSPQPSLEPAIEPSLGSSLIANGIVPRPRPPRPDPLASIRRMSQTEKIALFS
ncbi:MAG: hypothetical protein E8A46_14435 [Bradyrhizobium sp.]|uniref:hypothetical protein n=1 Tax=Bradyrhizobium sp. TaxID=376 RepID=UPI0011FBE1B5|nr:hypothetical protein [Bradyrhizobium sp.]THD51882.1 MAG: hypothetical protein E8A46_14435 [Bradyrhizobium sp.]